MPNLKKILIVDDNSINRTILSKILSSKYIVLEAENGQMALNLLDKYSNEISAVMLDILMPIMSGYDFLQAIRQNSKYNNLPIIVTTGSHGAESERKALSLGAWDFVSKPYDAEIIMFRLKNAIDKSQLSALKQLQYLAEYDALTGIYNKAKFFETTREMIDANPSVTFAFLRFDVDRFKLINTFFGTAEGDKLLIYIAEKTAEDVKNCELVTYGRISGDIVGVCMPYEKEKIEKMVLQSKKTLAQFNTNYDIVPSIGIYIITDNKISVDEMYNRASLASRVCKGNYVDFYAYYNQSMSEDINAEQEITNEMNYALENGQFHIYLQPQYNIHTNLPCGAEALVRWMHPKKGIILPGKFIPIFERNGFITKLDYYVWEQTCKCLSARREKGIKPYPISVNISRVNTYNPNLVETLLSLVKKYEVEPSLLHLELTESAYTDNPTAMKKTMRQLQDYGFVIMMDDFGSGYSSLSLLKDIAIDILKIDMQFLSKADSPGRSENIIASVIRMAKWLNIPVIAEGVETIEQIEFLRSVGCDYVQGYYYARPMPIEDYDKLCINLSLTSQDTIEKDLFCYDNLFSVNLDVKPLFSNLLQPVVIYEYVDDKIEIIRVNEAYYALLGYDDMSTNAQKILAVMDEDSKATLLNAFRTCSVTQKNVECEYMRLRNGGNPVWIHTNLKYVSMVGNKKILIGELSDITIRKALDEELKKYRTSLLLTTHKDKVALIVDDVEINRIVLKKILQGRFTFLEAENGKEAIKILEDNQVDLILLDISMPVMGGREFLQYKKSCPHLDVTPVIIITADDTPAQQINAFSLGANDYIVKPLIPEVVTRRIDNVLDSNQRFKEMVKEYNTMSQQVKTDLMTGLFNRISAEDIMTRRLLSSSKSSAMIMLDIDNFKKINDSLGHDYGDKVICKVAEKLRQVFGQNYIIARMGGDEFAVLMNEIDSVDSVEKLAKEFCLSMLNITIDGKNTEITCSVGIAVSLKEDNSFATIYTNADKALYNAKCHGRNTVSVYGDKSIITSISKWINDAENVVDTINDSIYACNSVTYELLYVNDNLCKTNGVTREECKGKKCYEILMKRSSPCEFCSMPRMEQDKVYTRLFRKPNTKDIFLMRGKTIERGGISMHLEVIVDISEVENMNLFWEGVKDSGRK
ncbi:MAG: EAL domain-containing protein [Clostridia bacterium]